MGRTYSEAELDTAMGGSGTGVPSFAILRLGRLGLEVDYRQWALTDLYQAMQRDTPVIALINTLFLDTWNVESACEGKNE